MESVLISDSGNTEQQADKVEHKNGDTQQLDGSKTEERSPGLKQDVGGISSHVTDLEIGGSGQRASCCRCQKWPFFWRRVCVAFYTR